MSTFGTDLNDSWSVSVGDSRSASDSNPPPSAGTFATITELWRYMKNIEFVLERLPPFGLVRLCRTRLQQSLSGPELSFLLPSSSLEEIKSSWTNSSVLLVGESLSDADLLFGLTLERNADNFSLRLHHDAALSDDRLVSIAQRLVHTLRLSFNVQRRSTSNARSEPVPLPPASSSLGASLVRVASPSRVSLRYEPEYLLSTASQPALPTQSVEASPNSKRPHASAEASPILEGRTSFDVWQGADVWQGQRLANSDLTSPSDSLFSPPAPSTDRRPSPFASPSSISPTSIFDLARFSIGDFSSASSSSSSSSIGLAAGPISSSASSSSSSGTASAEEAAAAATAASVAGDAIESSLLAGSMPPEIAQALFSTSSASLESSTNSLMGYGGVSGALSSLMGAAAAAGGVGATGMAGGNGSSTNLAAMGGAGAGAGLAPSSSPELALLADLRMVLQPYMENFTVSINKACPPEAATDLAAEGCPKCLQLTDQINGAPSPCMVLRCQPLDCQHVIHANCMLNTSPLAPTLHRYHSTNFFRTVPVMDPNEPDPVARDPVGVRRCTLELEISHLLSNAQILRIDWPYINTTHVDPRSGKEYLLCRLDPEQHRVFFFIERARMVFNCTDSISRENVQHDANYNLHGVINGSRYVKLVLVDAATRNTLVVGIRRKPELNAYYVAFVKYEFFQPPNPMYGAASVSMGAAMPSTVSSMGGGYPGGGSSLMASAVTRPEFTPSGSMGSLYPPQPTRPAAAAGYPPSGMGMGMGGYLQQPQQQMQQPYSAYGKGPAAMPAAVMRVGVGGPQRPMYGGGASSSTYGSTGGAYPSSYGRGAPGAEQWGAPAPSIAAGYRVGSGYGGAPGAPSPFEEAGMYGRPAPDAGFRSSDYRRASPYEEPSRSAAGWPSSSAGSPTPASASSMFEHEAGAGYPSRGHGLGHDVSPQDSDDDDDDRDRMGAGRGGAPYPRVPSPDFDGFRRAEHDEMNPANMTGPMVTGIPEIDNHIGMGGPNHPAIIDHVVGRVYMLSKSQGGSRFVQQKLDEGDPTYFSIFFDELKLHMAELMMDSFAHYAIEKLIRNCTPQQRVELLQSLLPDLVSVACHKQGSFSIQSMMDALQTDDEIAMLAHGLEQDMVRLTTNASGHFVVLRFMQHFPHPKHIQFILEAIQKSCLEIATDHHGLRVLKTVIDSSPASELHGVYKSVARLTMKLAENQYGNYCIQHVLDHAPPNVCANIKMKMEGKYVRLAKQKFSSNVVEKCLRTSNHEWRSVIIRELIASVGEMIRDRYGNYVLQTAVSLADAPQIADFTRAVTPHLQQLRENVRTKWTKIIKTATQRAQQGSMASPMPPQAGAGGYHSHGMMPPPSSSNMSMSGPMGMGGSGGVGMPGMGPMGTAGMPKRR